MTPRSLAIGIPVHNRRPLVEFNAFSLSRMEVPQGFDLRLIVLDDASTEFKSDFLRGIYPAHAKVIRRDVHSGGADLATVDLLGRLVAEDTDAVMILDSDFIMRADIVRAIAEYLPCTDGLLSLFNTDSHRVHQEHGALLLKRTIGAAGTVWTRSLAAQVLDNVPGGDNWDWRFCEYLRGRGTRIFCLRNSALQHLGFADGQNSNLRRGDFGNGFTDQVVEYLYFITEQIVRMQRSGFIDLNARVSNLERHFFGSTPRD